MKRWTVWILAILAVIIIFQLCYGFATIEPSNINWLMSAHEDWGTHYLGWAYYKSEPWHFPLGKITGYNYPVGTNVGFTDSIPLMAVFFKLFAPFLSNDFQYFGIWLFLCHLLVAYFAILLFRLFKMNWLISLAGAVFIAANPVLIYRGMHPALCAQWLLIACLYCYFLNPGTTQPKKILLYQWILLALSSLINPYLCWMVLGFTFAIPFKLCFFDKVIHWKTFLLYLGLSLFSIVLIWYLLGMVEFGRKEDLWVNGAYGLYVLNLNSLFNSGGFSRFFPALKQVSWHQYEGYMYLGLGILALISILFFYAGFVFIKSKSQKNKTERKARFVNNLLPLYVLTALYVIFSISLVFTWGTKELFRIPTPGFFIQLEETFRACARFFWVPYYLIIIFTIVGISKIKIKPVLTNSLIVGALILQLYDIKPILTFRHLPVGTYSPNEESKNWIHLMSQFDEVVFFPPFQPAIVKPMDYQDFSYMALKAGKPVNLGYVARADSRAMKNYSDSLSASVESGNLSTKVLYITNSANLEHFSQAVQSNTVKLNILDNCFYLFVKNPDNKTTDLLSDQLNAHHRMQLDSVLAEMSFRREFNEFGAAIPIVDNKSVRYVLQSLNIGEKFISTEGWAFIDSTQNNKGDSIFITLSNVDKAYIVRTGAIPRPDVSSYFHKTYLEDAGFKILVFTDSVQKGKYQLGIAIKDRKGHFAFQPIGKEVKVKISSFAVPEKITQLPVAGNITYSIDELTERDSVVSVRGWATLENQDLSNCLVKLVLKNEDNIYIYPTDLILRPDITAYFKNGYNLDSCGYSVKLLKGYLMKGRYKLGILIQDLGHKTESVIFTDKRVSIQ